MMFEQKFSAYVCEGDSIESAVVSHKHRTGLRFVATIYRDDSGDTPEERDDGFWPSRDPEAAGYIGDDPTDVTGRKQALKLKRLEKEAQARLDAWRADQWFYCGVAVRAWFDDIPLTGEYDHALWGIESDAGDYLREVANDMLQECEREAITRLTKIVEAGAEALSAE